MLHIKETGKCLSNGGMNDFVVPTGHLNEAITIFKKIVSTEEVHSPGSLRALYLLRLCNIFFACWKNTGEMLI